MWRLGMVGGEQRNTVALNLQKHKYAAGRKDTDWDANAEAWDYVVSFSKIL